MINRLFHSLRFRSKDSVLESYFKEFLAFGLKEVLACLFPAFIFIMLVVSRLVDIPGLPRYDFLLVACLIMQAFMFFANIETRQELLVITMFHLLGLIMEIYKVKMGSWLYPEDSYTKLMGVPLYSGFMYASVGSYVCQAWRWFDLRISNWPGAVPAIAISLVIYLNFFTHHFFYDLRWIATGALVAVFWKTSVEFNTNGQKRKMPMVIAFFLIGFFIWIAENIATFLGAWKYASQHDGWKMVEIGKISSWFLLIVLSIVIVAQLKFVKALYTRSV